jgi:hypothetical protein
MEWRMLMSDTAYDVFDVKIEVGDLVGRLSASKYRGWRKGQVTRVEGTYVYVMPLEAWYGRGPYNGTKPSRIPCTCLVVSKAEGAVPCDTEE